MANEFPQLSDVFALDKQVTYKEAVEQVWLPQDNAILSVPSASPIETLTLSGYTITPTVALGAITYESGTTAELHFIDYSNLRDGAIIQIRILDNTYPITIKNGITGNGGIFTNNGEDILLSDYRKIVQLQREGSIWRQVGTIQSANLPITNCITEIPQDIKLELKDGVLTLKAGSKVYVPNGFEADGVTPKFDEVVIESDKTHTLTVAGQWKVVFTDGDTAWGTGPRIDNYNTNIYSGNTAPSVSSRSNLWYDTANNVMKTSYDNGASWVVSNCALPIGLITATTTGITSIDQVFNGFGYIDSTVFALPNVKGLIPNGRNEDGSLKNIEFTVDRVRPQTFTSADNFPEVTYWLTSTGEFGGANVNINYHSNINKVLYDVDGTSRAYCNAGGFAVVRGKITSFSPKLPFHAVDRNDMHLKQDKATAVNYDNITNCITEIPQDIKLELNNGTLTLKAGSKVYVPNGAGVFDVVTVASDKVVGQAGTVSGAFAFYRSDNGTCYSATAKVLSSGATAPSSPVNTTTWYDTTNNVIKVYNGSKWVSGVAFPLCRFSNSNSLVTSIDQVFNGFGYIGSTVFALPNVKGLIPNGRNADGSLKNIEFVNPVVGTHSINGTYSLKLCLAIGGIAAYFYAYDDVENAIYRTDTRAYYPSDRLIVGDISCTNGVITSLTPKTVFHAVDYNEAALKQNFQVVSTLPSSPQPDVFYFIPE